MPDEREAIAPMNTLRQTPVELMPCPFCGKQPRACPDTSYGAATVYCPDVNECSVAPQADADLVAGETLDDAVAKWNTRTPTPATTATVKDEALRKAVFALERIERWHGEFPETGRTWPTTGNPITFGMAYGSNGERDYMRGIAREALAACESALDAPAPVDVDQIEIVAQICEATGWTGVAAGLRMHRRVTDDTKPLFAIIAALLSRS
jgi:hypothetical protein